jgi:hypothetical protein
MYTSTSEFSKQHLRKLPTLLIQTILVILIVCGHWTLLYASFPQDIMEDLYVVTFIHDEGCVIDLGFSLTK